MLGVDYKSVGTHSSYVVVFHYQWSTELDKIETRLSANLYARSAASTLKLLVDIYHRCIWDSSSLYRDIWKGHHLQVQQPSANLFSMCHEGK